MEHVLELIEKGRAGYVTAMGMGGVFTALIFLFLFIASLGKVYRFRKLRGRKPSAPDSKPPASADRPDDAKQVAAVAVALALGSGGRRTGVSVSPLGEEEPSPWKVAGRLSMMRPFARPKKD
jgi:Na+-transporting methylmalonyl-CoA/oxaloacetate decarboxylase gamma subunit